MKQHQHAIPTASHVLHVLSCRLGAVCVLHLLVLCAADAHQRHSRLSGETEDLTAPIAAAVVSLVYSAEPGAALGIGQQQCMPGYAYA
jgi:hypothetical protein